MNGTDNGSRDMTLVNAFRPQLVAGKYTLTATQSIVVETSPDKIETWTERKTFWVRAPRFALAPDELYSVYPPDGQTGAFHDTVPHVVFRRKALPWERKIDGVGKEKAPPWMAIAALSRSASAMTITAFLPPISHVTLAPRWAALA